MATALMLLAICSSAGADELTRAARGLVADYRSELGRLADWCDQRGLGAQAEKTRTWLEPRDPNRLYMAILPEEVGSWNTPPDPLTGARPEAVVQWHEQFVRLRREQADALYDLARRAVRGGRASLAFDLVMAALRENPDHQAIRRLFGFQEYEGRWRTVYEVRNLRLGKVWHEKFGWLPASHVRRYEEGQRYHGGRWVTAEEDARLHGDIRSGWDVETEHYTIRTNHSLEAGVQLGKQLERLYRVWKQLFVRYFASGSQVAALFDGRGRARPIRLPRHGVVYFRDRQEYIQTLRRDFPNIDISVGFYLEDTRRAYFFAGQGQDERTLLHEATHQLFHESRPVAPDVGREANFWILEGIAMYMESLRDEEDYHVLGGRYRDALVAYLVAVYSGRDEPGTLVRLTGVPFSQLDQQYRQFIEAGGKSPAGSP